jgi:hypothetical protein
LGEDEGWERMRGERQIIKRSERNFASKAFSFGYCFLNPTMLDLEVFKEDGVRKGRCKVGECED